MVQRITIYGWIINNDPVRGPGSGSLVDLVYWVSDDVIRAGREFDLFRIIESAGYKLIAKRIGNRRVNPVEQDRITIENWNDHLKVGVEKVDEPQFEQPQEEYHSRYDL